MTHDRARGLSMRSRDSSLALRLAGDGEEGLWRVSLNAVDAWTLRATAAGQDDRGPFARLLGSP